MPGSTDESVVVAALLSSLQMTREVKPVRIANDLIKDGVGIVPPDDVQRYGDFWRKVASEMRVAAAKRSPPAPKAKHSPAQSRDPLKADWSHFDADELEAAIADTIQYGIDHHGKETHEHKEGRLRLLVRMKKHRDEQRATERAAEAATRH